MTTAKFEWSDFRKFVCRRIVSDPDDCQFVSLVARIVEDLDWASISESIAEADLSWMASPPWRVSLAACLLALAAASHFLSVTQSVRFRHHPAGEAFEQLDEQVTEPLIHLALICLFDWKYLVSGLVSLNLLRTQVSWSTRLSAVR
jgi:hypothetical protein